MGVGTTPEEWCRRLLPLLNQYLAANDDRFATAFFGVSAQGGDYSNAAELRKAHHRASDRIRVVSGDEILHDITGPCAGLSVRTLARHTVGPSVRVDQLLHGYRDGHRLLAGSKELSRAAKHMMLTLSDMSGRSTVAGFEDYLTAYPIPEAEAYAFARTWYAPEMERPGCVWTHTLVVNNSDLDAFDNLSVLGTAFRRPVKAAAVDSYTQPVEVPAGRNPAPPVLDSTAVAILGGLYATPDVPVVVPAPNATSLQDVAVAVWSQQWAELRATFSFCTGSISSRSLMGRPFDLQFVPGSTVREIRRELASAIVVDATTPHVSSGEEWLRLALGDLTDPDPTLRRLLRSFGGSFGCALGGRAAFEPLLQFVMSGVASSGRTLSLRDVVDAIAERFASTEAARRLKVALIGPDAPITRVLFPDQTEKDVLSVVATTSRPDAFDRADLQIEGRVQGLWTEQRTQGEQLVDYLLSHNHNTFGESMLSSVLSAVPQADVAALFAGRPGVVVAAVKRDPAIAMSSGIWTGQADAQRELFDAATVGHETTPEVVDGIVAAMLTANSDAVVDQVLGRFGESSVAAVLSWLEDNPGVQVGVQWHRLPARYPSAVLGWLSSRKEPPLDVLALAAHVLDPHSPEVHRSGLSMWQTAIGHDSSLGEKGRVQLHAFMLALALDYSTNQACEMTVATFETVHAAAARRSLGYDAWSFFDRRLPHLSIFRNWDRCERLRRGLVDRFVEYEWPVGRFVECAHSAGTLAELVRTCYGYSPTGRTLLERMSDEKGSIRTALPQQWWDAIRHYL